MFVIKNQIIWPQIGLQQDLLAVNRAILFFKDDGHLPRLSVEADFTRIRAEVVGLGPVGTAVLAAFDCAAILGGVPGEVPFS